MRRGDVLTATVFGNDTTTEMSMIDRAGPILTSAEALHREPMKESSSGRFYIRAPNSYGPRQTVDAATDAEIRKIAYPSWRTCATFETRLDTAAVAKNCRSLKLALTILALLNRDLSLLVQDAYGLDSEGSAPDPRWLFPLSNSPHLMNRHQIRHGFFFTRAHAYQFDDLLTEEGIRVPGYSWTIDDLPLDFSYIQAVVRTDTTDEDDWNNQLPDEVGGQLFDHPYVRKNPFAMFQLDRTSTRAYAQFWFVERIMHDGYLWMARYDRSPYWKKRKEAQGESKTDQTSSDKKDEIPVDDETKGAEVNPSALGKAIGEVPDIGELKHQKTILERQSVHQMMIAVSGVTVFMNEDKDNTYSDLDRGLLTAFATGLISGTWTHDAEEKRVRDLVAAFDVDGPCTVVTPWNPNWEVLPRPDLRNMRACWVIEETGRRREEGLSTDSEDLTSYEMGDRLLDIRCRVLDKVKNIVDYNASASTDVSV
ncbi:MAG: hypothetical protein M1820_004397 [Bogoriella megaspora]|nr:MAG: hypothetical protein M1820_004397 [Bogoriella megaspora]